MLIALSLLLPALSAALILLAGLISSSRQDRIRRIVSIVAPVAVLPSIGLTIGNPGSGLDVPWFLFGISFSVDDLARAMTLIGAVLYGAALMSISWATRRAIEKNSGVLSGFLLACFTGNIGVYLAADAVSFYLCFALMSFSAVGLVMHYRTAQAYRATGIYLTMTVISETALLGGLFFTVHDGGMTLAHAPDAIIESERTGLIIALLLIGFGIKAGLMPLHTWLPLAYSAAPSAASAVLSGAMSKAGLVGFLRFLPLQTDDPGAVETAATLEVFGWILMALSLIGAFAAVILGISQKDAKVVLAYSSISQMGFMGTLVAVGLLDSALAIDAVDAAVLYAVHHGLAKGALFLGVPLIRRYGRGFARVLVAFGMSIAGVALAGAPATSGGIGKYVSKEAVGDLTVAGIGLAYYLPFVATGSTVLLLRFLWIVLTAERDQQRNVDGQLMAWLGVCVTILVVPWMIGAWWSPLELPEWSDPQTQWDATWPIGLGLLLGALVWWTTRRGLLPRRQKALVPAGDLVVVEEHLTKQIRISGGARLDQVHELSGKTLAGSRHIVSNVVQRVRMALGSVEGQIEQWPRFGATAVLLLTLAIVVSLISGSGT